MNLEQRPIFFKKEEGIASIYINRPEKRNAINSEMWQQLIAVVDDCNSDSSVRVIIFRSTSPVAFSAGADISEFKTARNSPEKGEEYHQVLSDLEERLLRSDKPTIAMIQGYCLGGGLELALACDFRFSDPTGKFSIPAAKLGIIYPVRSTKLLIHLVGPTRAKEILLSGEMMDVTKALEIGLINRVYDEKELEKETYQFAKTLAGNSELAIRGMKKVIHFIMDGEGEDGLRALFEESLISEDYKQRVRSFMNRPRNN